MSGHIPLLSIVLLTLPLCSVARAQSGQPTKYATIDAGEKTVIGGVAFSPDGERLSYEVSAKRIETWDVKTKKPLDQVYKAGKGKVWFDMAYSPDWKSIAVAEITDVVQIDVRTGGQTVLYTHLGKEKGLWIPWLVRYTPDGKRIVSVDMEGVLKVWDVAKKAAVAEIRCVRKGAVRDVVPVPGTDTAFVCVEESSPKKLQEPHSTDKLLLADLKAGTVKTIIDDVDFFRAAAPGSAVSRDGKLFALAHGEKVRIISTATLKTEADVVCPLDVYVCLFSDSGRLLIVGGSTPGIPPPFEYQEGEVTVYDRQTKKWISRFRVLDREVTSLALSPKGDLLAVASSGLGTITVWDLSPVTGKSPKR